MGVLRIGVCFHIGHSRFCSRGFRDRLGRCLLGIGDLRNRIDRCGVRRQSFGGKCLLGIVRLRYCRLGDNGGVGSVGRSCRGRSLGCSRRGRSGGGSRCCRLGGCTGRGGTNRSCGSGLGSRCGGLGRRTGKGRHFRQRFCRRGGFCGSRCSWCCGGRHIRCCRCDGLCRLGLCGCRFGCFLGGCFRGFLRRLLRRFFRGFFRRGFRRRFCRGRLCFCRYGFCRFGGFFFGCEDATGQYTHQKHRNQQQAQNVSLFHSIAPFLPSFYARLYIETFFPSRSSIMQKKDCEMGKNVICCIIMRKWAK